MTDRKGRTALTLSQALLLLIVAILLYLAVAFIRQVGVSHRLREELSRLEQSILTAEQERTKLQEQLEYVRSDEAVRDWGLPNQMVPEGEMLFVLAASGDEIGAYGSEGAGRGLGPDSPREAWWELFFGTR